jgi:uncharacterized YigZ family protein
MDKAIIVPAETSCSELEIKKSKFTGFCYYAGTEKEAKEIILSLKTKYKTATHVVYAFICGKPNSQTMGLSDDGEPKGTAGKPVLQVLRGSGLTNIVCVVIRYFGGIKLGTGGLVKAYTETAQAALRELKTKELMEESEITIAVSYNNFDDVRRTILSEEQTRIISEEFLSNVKIKVSIPNTKIEMLTNKIKNITSNKATILK